MVRFLKPKRVIEIGSGNSSRLIYRAGILNNMEVGNCPLEYTIIDPYPRQIVPVLENTGSVKAIKQKVELMEPEFFDHLEAKDILFVDSGHTVKTGSDVNFIILDVLPRLKSGVVVHFHDINLPYASPESYFVNPEFRVFWTEEYLLQAFLAFNNRFEVLLAMGYLQREYQEYFQRAFPYFAPESNWANSGSFWIRRK